MSRDRGHALQRATAAYLARWWPHCESTPNGRPGRDILGTPGVWWEVKTSLKGTSPAGVVRQAETGALQAAIKERARAVDVAAVVYWPPGVGARRPEEAIVMMSLPELMHLLEAAEYAPKEREP
jgi:hypothetical protein